jgi:hypothetical protein
MRRPLLPAAFAIASAFFVGCFDSGTSGETVPSRAMSRTLSYSVSADRIITLAPDDTDYHCNGNELERDVYPQEPDTVRFSLSGNTLSIYDPFVDTLGSGAVVQWASIAQRSGSGTGLEGAWRQTDRIYQVNSGALAQAERARLENELAESRHFVSFINASFSLSKGILTTYADINTAALFVDRWNEHDPEEDPESDSALFDITVKAVEKYTVELKGGKTGEIVRLEILPNEDMTYTSNQPGHAKHVYRSRPVSCPNFEEPDWYSEFRFANLKAERPLAKPGQIRSKRGFPGKFHRSPLKSLYSLLNYPT